MSPTDGIEQSRSPRPYESRLGGLRLRPLASGLHSPDSIPATVRARDCQADAGNPVRMPHLPCFAAACGGRGGSGIPAVRADPAGPLSPRLRHASGSRAAVRERRRRGRGAETAGDDCALVGLDGSAEADRGRAREVYHGVRRWTWRSRFDDAALVGPRILEDSYQVYSFRKGITALHCRSAQGECICEKQSFFLIRICL